MAAWLDSLKNWARAIKREVIALWLAARDRLTPWLARMVCAAIAAYALSPIDLIPDFIPVLGYLDEVILLPLAILLAIRLVPTVLMAEFRTAAMAREGRPISKAGMGAILAIWLTAAAGAGWLVLT